MGAIVQDPSGNSYITGSVASNSLTTTSGAFQPSAPPGGAAFVAKLDPTGAVAFLTYLGGTNSVGTSDIGSAIAVDPAGHIYVAGIALSSNFPLAGSPYRPAPGNAPTFLAEISSDGKTLIWSTLLNGAAPIQLALAPDGSLYDLFQTAVPIEENGTQISPGAIALLKLTSAGGFVAQMVVPPSTSSIAVGPDGSVYIGGSARPNDISATPGAWQTSITSFAGFVAKVNASVSGYSWVTYTGENVLVSQVKPVADGASLWVTGGDLGYGIAVTPGALQSQPGFGFLVRLSSDGTHAITATYLTSQPEILALDSSGNLLIESNYGGIFQATPGAPWPCETSYLFFGIIDSAAQHVLGGTSIPLNMAAGNVAGNNDTAVIAAQSRSATALTVTAINTASVSPNLVTSCIAPSAPGSTPSPLAPGELFSIYGAGFGPAQGVVAQPSDGKIATSLGGIQVTVEDTPVPLLYVSAAQINAVAPFLLEGRTAAHIKIETASATSNEVVLGVRDELPEIFAISNQNGTQNSQTHPAHAGDYLSIWASGLGQTDPPGVDGAIPTAAGAPPLAPVAVQATTMQDQTFIYASCFPAAPVNAAVLYAGNAPGLVSGVTQVNFQMPQLSPPSAVVCPPVVPPYAAILTLTAGGITASATVWFE